MSHACNTRECTTTKLQRVKASKKTKNEHFVTDNLELQYHTHAKMVSVSKISVFETTHERCENDHE